MRSLVDEKPDWMPVNCHLQDEVRGGSRLHCGSDYAIVVGVN